MPTVNYSIEPSDGWVQVATAPKFVRASGFPHTQPYYVYAGASSPPLVTAPGHGTVTFATGVPTAAETVLVGSETYTFRATRTVPFEVTIGVDNATTAANFKTAVNTDSTIVAATGASNVITLTSLLFGASYNYTLSETATNVSVSGAAFTGGVDIVQGVLVAHHPLKINVTMTENLYARVVTPQRDGQKFRLDVLTI